MNITQEKTGDLSASIKIELVPADYEEKVNKILKDHQRKANIPGFRPGHVPFGLIKKQYGIAVKLDEINKILSESLSSYLQENNIEILGNPLPDMDKTPPMSHPDQENFEFHFDVGLAPKFELSLSGNTEVNYYSIIADDKSVDMYVNNICKRYGTLVDTEFSEKDDTLEGDLLELDENHLPKTGGVVNHSSFVVNQIHHEEGVKKFLNLKKGDSVDFVPSETFAHGHEYTDVLGISQEKAEELKSAFRLVVSEVKRTVPAELGEDLYKLIYPKDELKTEDDFRNKIKEEIEKMYTGESERKFMNDSIEKLIETADISLPEDFLKKWLLETNKDKVPEEQLETEYEHYFKSLKWQLIENRVISEHQINVTNEDVKNYIKGVITRQYFPESQGEDSPALDSVVETILKNKDEVKRVYEQLYDEKLTQLFKENLNLKNNEVTYEAFIKLVSNIHE